MSPSYGHPEDGKAKVFFRESRGRVCALNWLCYVIQVSHFSSRTLVCLPSALCSIDRALGPSDITVVVANAYHKCTSVSDRQGQRSFIWQLKLPRRWWWWIRWWRPAPGPLRTRPLPPIRACGTSDQVTKFICFLNNSQSCASENRFVSRKYPPMNCRLDRDGVLCWTKPTLHTAL